MYLLRSVLNSKSSKTSVPNDNYLESYQERDDDDSETKQRIMMMIAKQPFHKPQQE